MRSGVVKVVLYRLTLEMEHGVMQGPTAHGERKGINRLKPIAMWAAKGTQKRSTGRNWFKNGHNTGSMRSYGLFDNEQVIIRG